MFDWLKKFKKKGVFRFCRQTVNASAPIKSYMLDAGFDLRSICNVIVPAQSYATVCMDLSFSIPSDCMLLVQGRSGLAHKHGLFTIGNVVDPGYTGPIHVCLCNMGSESIELPARSRIAQIIPVKIYDNFEMDEVITIDSSTGSRGKHGQGSTGL